MLYPSGINGNEVGTPNLPGLQNGSLTTNFSSVLYVEHIF